MEDKEEFVGHGSTRESVSGSKIASVGSISEVSELAIDLEPDHAR